MADSDTTESTWQWEAVLARIDTLSDRELAVLTLLGQGLGNRDIARRLDIGERGVKSHITAILRKLGVVSRLQAGLAAAELRYRTLLAPKDPLRDPSGSG